MISYGRQNIDQQDIDAVVDILQGDFLTCGPHVAKFENKLKNLTNASYASACSNGTTALHLALCALNVGPGDTILVPAITFLASANAVRFTGADVVFVDVDPDTALITVQALEDAIKKKPNANFKALINVHFAGQCADLQAIYAFAQKYGLKIIEDGAHAIGTSYVDSKGKSHPIGSNTYSDLTTFSFHPVKTIAMGEGGAVTTEDPALYQRISDLRTHGMIRDQDRLKNESHGPWYYEMQELGFNYRVSDINCALGASQLEKLDYFKQDRLKTVDYYDGELSGLRNVKTMKRLGCAEPAWHLYVAFLDFDAIGKSRQQIVQELHNKGIGTQIHYMPLYQHPYYEDLYGKMTLPGAEAYYKACISLPLFVGLTEQDKKNVVTALKLYQ
ncbi:MAG: UDP-4-amino-4,6-dideoxy-N-acetyl-beta-L-altrosamine transaminase [Alphaproteobacteria bacterium CG_4_10_14_0_8_um_filter_37_21]|nr:MAG: UDP-4-amino-4,6-dideoxy-N-acetyl-beta-L-altrosamine transaminase [Alphaproteobacteria bacterium CG_4_10_14_0_8_um_filter_37_21]